MGIYISGGVVEEGERPKRAAAREAEEEADLHFSEFDLIPAQRNPSIERWGGGFHRVYKYFAYVDRRRMKPRRMESKLSEWKVISYQEMVNMIRRLELPDWVLRGWWRDVLHDTRYDRLS